MSSLKIRTVGDGTTSAVLLAAALLRTAQQLVMRGYHPTHIIEEYRESLQMALGIIEKLGISLNDAMMHHIACTSIRSKVLGRYVDHFSKLGIDAVSRSSQVRVVVRTGNSMLQSQFIGGVLFVLRERLPHATLRIILDPRVLVTRVDLMKRSSWVGTSVIVSSYSEASACAEEELKEVIKQCQQIVDMQVQAVVVLGPISPVAEQFLVYHKVVPIVVYNSEELDAASLCTRCPVISDLRECKVLGQAQAIEITSHPEGDVVSIINNNDKICTVELRAPSEELGQECKRSFEDMLRVLQVVRVEPVVVGGGASATMEIAHRIRSFYNSLTSSQDRRVLDRRRVVGLTFADACEAIAYQLASNAGASVCVVEEAKRRHQEGVVWAGIDSCGKVCDMVGDLSGNHSVDDIQNNKVLEPAAVIRSALRGAVDTAELILKIDRNVLAQPRPELGDEP